MEQDTTGQDATSETFRLQIRTQDCDLSSRDMESMESDLACLQRLVGHLPMANLYVDIQRYLTTGGVHVTTSLQLAGCIFFTQDRDFHLHSAYKRCIRKLIRKEGGNHDLG